MADTTELLLMILGESAPAVRSIEEVNAALGRMEGAAQRTNTALNLLKGAVIGVAALGAAMAGVAAISTKMAGDFQREMEMVHTQAGAAQSEVDSLKGKVLELASVVGTAPDELAKGLYHIESAGWRGTKAMDMLRGAAQLAKVGQADLEDTTQALVGTMAAFEDKGMTVDRALGILNATVGTGDMRLEKLAKGLATGILPAAATFGLTLVDVGAALATLTDNVTPADEAATRLRMTFSLLAAPSGIAAKHLAEIGLSSSQLATDMRKNNGLLVALQDLKSHLDSSGKSAEEQAQVISRAFGGGRSSAAIMTLLGQMDRLESKYAAIEKGANSFGESWRATTENFNFQLDRVHAGLDAFAISIGNRFLPAGTAAARWFADSLPVMEGWVNHVLDLASALTGPLTTAFNGIRSVAADVWGFISQIFGIFGQLAALFAPTPRTPTPATAHLPADIRPPDREHPEPERSRREWEGFAPPRDERVPTSTPRPSGPADRDHENDIRNRRAIGYDLRDEKMAVPKPETIANQLGQSMGAALAGAAGAIGEGIVNAFRKAIDSIDWFDAGKSVADIAFPFMLGLLGGMFGPKTIESIKQHWFEMLVVVVVTGLSIAFAPAKLIGPIANVLSKIPILGPLLAWLVRGINALGAPARDLVSSFFGVAFKSLWRGFEEELATVGGGRLVQAIRAILNVPDLIETFAIRGLYMAERFFETLGRAIARSGPAEWQRAWIYVTRAIEETGARLVTWLGELAVRGWRWFAEEMMRLWEGIGGRELPGIVREFRDILEGIARGAREIGERAMTWLRDRIVEGGSWVLRELGTFANGARSAFDGLVRGVESVAGRLSEAISSPFKTGAQQAVRILNGLIQALDNIPGIGGAISKVIGKGDIGIPFLAEGAIVTDPTLAMIGEAGPEAVIPLGGGPRAMDLWLQAGQALGAGARALGAGAAAVGDWGGQCVVYVEQVTGRYWPVAMASQMTQWMNSSTPSPGEVFVSTLPPYGHTGIVIGPNSVIDSNWGMDERVQIHALSDIPAIAGYIDLGLGAVAGFAGAVGGAVRSAIGALIGGPLGAAMGEANALGGIGGALATSAVDVVGNAVKALSFDEGGLLMPGLTMALNRTGQPEQVLGPGIAGRLEELLRRLGDGAGTTNNVYVTNPAPQPYEIAQELAWMWKTR